MKTLFPALRVSDLAASLRFYGSVGYDVVGTVDAHPTTRLVMLALPDEAEVSLELVHRGAEESATSGGLDHLAVQVDDLVAARRALLDSGYRPGPVETPGGADGPRTSTVADPDGHRIELVQWPEGHPVGMMREDFRESPSQLSSEDQE